VTSALSEYLKIQEEIFYNRLEKSEYDRIQTRIVLPLQDLTHARDGEVSKTITEANRTHGEVEVDEALFKAEQGTEKIIPLDIRQKHIVNLQKTGVELDALVKKLNLVIQAIGDEFDKKRAETLLVAIIEDQQRQTEELRIMHEAEKKKILDLLKGLGE
jgi:hypothetical protein